MKKHYEYLKDYTDAYRQLYYNLNLTERTRKEIVKKIDKKFSIVRDGHNIIFCNEKIEVSK
ncbi:MAG: hypothetical protein PHS93_08065 [Candidatus Omnitrophica bacterium]|nr:hypothetical protein [Candidatus Omnitrophota bacterium]MDD5353097.1 hypothetical protein [Candidatus Omnitrophota bacterium]